MTEFKEKLINDLTKELSENFWVWIDIQRGNLEMYIKTYLKDKLGKDYIIIDKNKLKEHLVVTNNEHISDLMFSEYITFKVSVNYAENITKAMLKMCDFDFSEYVKDKFIKCLEECDF